MLNYISYPIPIYILCHLIKYMAYNGGANMQRWVGAAYKY